MVMLEKVAKALYDTWSHADETGQDVPWQFVPDEIAEQFLNQARKVMEAIHDPTDGMIDAGFGATPLPPMRAARKHYVAAYKAMISHIWSGKPG